MVRDSGFAGRSQGSRRDGASARLRAAAAVALAAAAVLIGCSLAWAWEEPEGFKGIRFGSAPTAFPGLMRETGCRWSNIGPFAWAPVVFFIYDCPERWDWLADVPLESLLFDYGPEGLGAVSWDFSADQFPTMRALFMERYGSPTTAIVETVESRQGVKHDNPKLRWSGQTTYVELDQRGAYDGKLKIYSLVKGRAKIGTKAYREWSAARFEERERGERAKGAKALD